MRTHFLENIRVSLKSKSVLFQCCQSIYCQKIIKNFSSDKGYEYQSFVLKRIYPHLSPLSFVNLTQWSNQLSKINTICTTIYIFFHGQTLIKFASILNLYQDMSFIIQFEQNFKTWKNMYHWMENAGNICHGLVLHTIH